VAAPLELGAYGAAFLGSGAVVIAAGMSLARHADHIAEATGIGRLWAGAVLMAAATSLPELATDVAAVRWHATNLAVGDLLGSSMANMLLLGILDLVYLRRRVLRSSTLDHALAASLAIGLNALASALVLLRPQTRFVGIEPGAAALMLLYLAGSRAVYWHARERAGAPTEGAPGPARDGLRSAWLGFGLAAAAIAGAAPLFAWAAPPPPAPAPRVARVSGLGNTFVGTVLLGLSTSLPELASSLAAVRAGAFDLAVGNLFGSNAANMAILFVLDLVKSGPPLFADLDPTHALSGLFSVILMSLALAAIVYRAERRPAMLAPNSVLILLTYGAAAWVLLQRTRPG
jgi:cation:H+ antiporter